jgi:hypothetical protein
MRYVVESGLVVPPGQNQMWQPQGWPNEDRDAQIQYMNSLSHQMPQSYSPEGNRRLRVRAVER